MNLRQTLLFMYAVLAVICSVPAAATTYCGEGVARAAMLTKGDSSTSTQLNVTRAATKLQRLTVRVCSGQVMIRRDESGSELRLHVTSTGADRSLAQYLIEASVEGGSALIDLRIPSRFKSTVTLYVPSAKMLDVDLASGVLTLQASGSGGDESIDVAAGTVRLIGAASRNYAQLTTDIGLGRLRDLRPGGSALYSVVDHTFYGTGRGNIDVSLGTGEIDLLEDDRQ